MSIVTVIPVPDARAAPMPQGQPANASARERESAAALLLARVHPSAAGRLLPAGFRPVAGSFRASFSFMSVRGLLPDHQRHIGPERARAGRDEPIRLTHRYLSGKCCGKRNAASISRFTRFWTRWRTDRTVCSQGPGALLRMDEQENPLETGEYIHVRGLSAVCWDRADQQRRMFGRRNSTRRRCWKRSCPAYRRPAPWTPGCSPPRRSLSQAACLP